jgi:hypothetical protein
VLRPVVSQLKRTAHSQVQRCRYVGEGKKLRVRSQGSDEAPETLQHNVQSYRWVLLALTIRKLSMLSLAKASNSPAAYPSATIPFLFYLCTILLKSRSIHYSIILYTLDFTSSTKESPFNLLKLGENYYKLLSVNLNSTKSSPNFDNSTL